MTSPAADAPRRDDAPPAKKPGRLRRAVTSVLLCALLLVGGVKAFQFLAGLRKQSVRAHGQELPEVVRVKVARRGPFTETLEGFGKARALREITVAAEVAGRVEWVSEALEPGSPITFQPVGDSNGSEAGHADGEKQPPAGPLAVRIDDRDLHDQHERAAAELAAVDTEIVRLGTVAKNLEERLELATKEFDAAKREWDRIERLVSSKRLPPGDLDQERLKLLLRERAVVDLESQLRENEDATRTLEKRRDARASDLLLAQRNLARAKIHVGAPGVVESRDVGVGDRVAPGQALFVLLDLSRVEIPIALPARRYPDVVPGAGAVVHNADTGAELWRGSVTRVAPAISERDRTFFVYLIVEGEPTANPVPPGTHVRAEIEGATHEDVVVVPREAFVGGALFVVKPDPDAPPDSPDRYVIAERRTPAVLRMLTAVAVVRAEEGGGIDEGEEFVVTNLESVADGARLRVAPETATPDDGTDGGG